MNPTNQNRYGPLSEDVLRRFESRLGVQLPSDYRNFLLAYNGGSWKKKCFYISEDQGSSLIHHVYGLHDGPEYLRLDSAHERFRGRIRDGLIPLADDQGGNQVCIGLVGLDREKVFFFDHETDGIVFIKPSFTEFVESLTDVANNDVLSRALENDDVESVSEFVKAGYDPEATDENGRTLIERAAIKGSPQLIAFLARSGVNFGRALELARKNATYFDEHKVIVELLLKLQQERRQ